MLNQRKWMCENMSDITIEKKLELMRQVRARNEQNRFDMCRREQILYGRTTPVHASNERLWEQNTYMEDTDEAEGLQTFPLRILLSLGLFLLIIICDMSGKSIMGINAGQCFETIAVDYESSITAWVDAASANNLSEMNSDITDTGNVEKNPPTGSRP